MRLFYSHSETLYLSLGTIQLHIWELQKLSIWSDWWSLRRKWEIQFDLVHSKNRSLPNLAVWSPLRWGTL